MRKVNPVKVGPLTLGGGTVYVQSMLSRPAHDIEANVRQAKELEAAGCEILRFAVPDGEALKLIPALKEAVSLPLVADIHFDYRLALGAAERGIDKIRINPGNIGEEARVREVADACRSRGIPIRIGVNSGSVEKRLLEQYGGPTARALADSAFFHVRLLEKCDFTDIVVSIKASNVKTMVEANRIFARESEYPLHIGVTEAGTERMGLIKSAAGIGSLLLDGIGETIRVSLTDEPVREIAAAYDLLKALDIRRRGPEIVSCPTCGRTQIDLIRLVTQVEEALQSCTKDIKVAVMGCAVNGPGEAREADVGIAGGDGCGLLFKKGRIVRKVPEEGLLRALLEAIEEF